MEKTMRLLHNKETGKWFWADGYTRSQDFDTKTDAIHAKRQERDECIRLGIDPDSTESAGVLKWKH
jgi:hypothetical protein